TATASAVCTSARKISTQAPHLVASPSVSPMTWNSSARKPAAAAAAAAPCNCCLGSSDTAASRPASSGTASSADRPIADADCESPLMVAPLKELVISAWAKGRKPSRKMSTPSAATPTSRKNGSPLAAAPAALAPAPAPDGWPGPGAEGAEGVAGVLYPEPPVG